MRRIIRDEMLFQKKTAKGHTRTKVELQTGCVEGRTWWWQQEARTGLQGEGGRGGEKERKKGYLHTEFSFGKKAITIRHEKEE
jgi:hypothetical protein